MQPYLGLIGVGAVVLLTACAWMWIEYFCKTMDEEEEDEYKAEYSSFSLSDWNAAVDDLCKPNKVNDEWTKRKNPFFSKLTAINAVKGESHEHC